MEILGYISAVFMGLSLGVIGGGGSILTVPILVYLFGRDATLATTESLFIVGITALVGALIKAKKGAIDFRVGFLFAIPSFAGVFVSRKILLPLIPETLYENQGVLISKSLLILLSFAVLMIFASRAMIKSGGSKKMGPPAKHTTFSILLKGFLIGIVTGFVGAGGGFLIIPALVLLLHLPMEKAVGTSLAIIAANSLFGFSISIQNQNPEWSLLIKISVIGIIGLILGHQIAGKLPEARLKKGFGYFVLIVGTLIVFDQLYRL